MRTAVAASELAVFTPHLDKIAVTPANRAEKIAATSHIFLISHPFIRSHFTPFLRELQSVPAIFPPLSPLSQSGPPLRADHACQRALQHCGPDLHRTGRWLPRQQRDQRHLSPDDQKPSHSGFWSGAAAPPITASFSAAESGTERQNVWPSCLPSPLHDRPLYCSCPETSAPSQRR